MNPLVQIENLTNYALRNVSICIESGEIYGIVGSSGAGKTTLIRSVTGLLKPDDGRVYLAGQEISSLQGKALREARKSLGMIFQHFNLFSSKSAFDNVLFPMEVGGEVNRERAYELLKLVGLEGKEHCYPSTLSGGEKQRVAIARALANQPQVLLCDEATSALDPNTTRSILDLLVKLNQTLGITLIFITHQMEVIKRVCHKVAVLEKGEIVEKGDVVELFSNPRHPTTKRFLQHLTHDLPEHFLPKEKGKQLLRLRFKGKRAEEPVITHLIRTLDVEVNILLGGVDCLQQTTVGSLVVELSGSDDTLRQAALFLQNEGLAVEELT